MNRKAAQHEEADRAAKQSGLTNGRRGKWRRAVGAVKGRAERLTEGQREKIQTGAEQRG